MKKPYSTPRVTAANVTIETQFGATKKPFGEGASFITTRIVPTGFGL